MCNFQRGCSFLNIAIIFFGNILLFHVNTYAQNSKVILEADFGYQTNNLNWSIAGNLAGEAPNILSELKWQDLTGPVVRLELIIPIHSFFVSTGLKYNHIINGFVSDADYLSDNRESMISNVTYNSNKGYNYSADFLIGYNYFENKTLKNSMFGGLNICKQMFYLLDNNDENTKHLNSKYDSVWKGLLLGLSSKIKVSTKFDLQVDLRASFMKFNAMADWNLIGIYAHPISFIQNAPFGFKLNSVISSYFKLNNMLQFLARFETTQAFTNKGIDKVFYSSGKVVETRFNGVNNDSFSGYLGLKISF